MSKKNKTRDFDPAETGKKKKKDKKKDKAPEAELPSLVGALNDVDPWVYPSSDEQNGLPDPEEPEPAPSLVSESLFPKVDPTGEDPTDEDLHQRIYTLVGAINAFGLNLIDAARALLDQIGDDPGVLPKGDIATMLPKDDTEQGGSLDDLVAPFPSVAKYLPVMNLSFTDDVTLFEAAKDVGSLMSPDEWKSFLVLLDDAGYKLPSRRKPGRSAGLLRTLDAELAHLEETGEPGSNVWNVSQEEAGSPF